MKALKDNRLLFDRPLSYWTIGVFSINAAFISLVSAGQTPPVWLNLAEPFAVLPWLFVFLKGGAWAWFKKFIPEQKEEKAKS